VFVRALGGKVTDLPPRAGDLAWLVRRIANQVRRRRAVPVDAEQASVAPGGS